MTVVIKKSDTKEIIASKLEKFYAARKKTITKGFNALKYAGKLKGVYGDGLKYQKKMRNEWDR